MVCGNRGTKMDNLLLKAFIMKVCGIAFGDGGIAMDNCREKNFIKVKCIITGFRIVIDFRVAMMTLFEIV